MQARTDSSDGGADAAVRRRRAVLTASVCTTVASVYPAFLTGALGPELRPALGMSESTFGFAVGGFFLGAAIGSVLLGRLGERWGARRTITTALLLTAVAAVAIATVVRSGGSLAVALLVAGVANAASQTSVNKLLSDDTDPDRLGFAIAVKQSGMPSATLLGGLAVPVLALTVGWRWAYLAAAVLAIAALAVVRAVAGAESSGAPTAAGSTLPSTPPSTLWLTAVGGGFASAAAGTLGNWLTSSAVDAGWGSGPAGLLLAVGSVSGITARLLLGRRADRRPDLAPMTTAARFLVLGALGAVLLAPRSESLHLLAAVVSFGAGWSWPALFNFAIVRANEEAPARATGVTQTGVYVGVLVGPAAMGLIVDRFGYAPGWILVGLSMAAGSAVMAIASPRYTMVR